LIEIVKRHGCSILKPQLEILADRVSCQIVRYAGSRERSLLYKSNGKTGLDMVVVDINKNFLFILVMPAFWEVDGT